jgi:hypothetical protein
MRMIMKGGLIRVWGEVYSSRKSEENLPGNIEMQPGFQLTMS